MHKQVDQLELVLLVKNEYLSSADGHGPGDHGHAGHQIVGEGKERALLVEASPEQFCGQVLLLLTGAGPPARLC